MGEGNPPLLLLALPHHKHDPYRNNAPLPPVVRAAGAGGGGAPAGRASSADNDDAARGPRGGAQDVGPGEAAVIPPGFEGEFEVLEPVRKHFVVVES